MTETFKERIVRQPLVSTIIAVGMVVVALTAILSFTEKYRPWPSHDELDKQAEEHKKALAEIAKEQKAAHKISYQTAISYWTDQRIQLRVHLGEARRDKDANTERLVERDLSEVEAKLSRLRRLLEKLN